MSALLLIWLMQTPIAADTLRDAVVMSVDDETYEGVWS